MRLKCEEANMICDKNQYKEASFWEKVRLNLHLIFCRLCRRYSSNNMKLTKAIKNVEYKSMSQDEKQVIKERIQQEINKL